ncbi:hypothetical protein ACSZOP_00945 [Colibacter massiliensis]|uniref:hypothetical protein n=1 Tax=Colibacter massiliensis TaxID=1852379 RepID=UPI003F8F6A99
MICINDIKEKYMPFIIGLTSCVLFFLFCRDAALYDLCRNWRETNRLLAAYDADDRDGGESRPFAIGEKTDFPGLMEERAAVCEVRLLSLRQGGTKEGGYEGTAEGSYGDIIRFFDALDEAFPPVRTELKEIKRADEALQVTFLIVPCGDDERK